jgi:signal transduction histidine kinase
VPGTAILTGWPVWRGARGARAGYSREVRGIRRSSATRSGSSRAAAGSPSPAGRDAARVRFEVSDSGPGIAEDQIPRLFERYWQGRSSPRGSLGLGLYICKQLVAAHGGDIGVASRLGEGATFWFMLPTAG